MRIGIDATALPPEPVGAGTYIIQLVRALADSDSDHEWVVFAHRSRIELFGEMPGRTMEWIPIRDKSPFQRLIWEQTTLPTVAKQTRLDILHSLHYTRPNRLECASVVTFHDMTFFLYPQLHTLPKRTFFPVAIRSSARRANALIAVSETTRQDTIRLLNVSPEKIFTCPNGVSPDFHPISDASRLEACRNKYHLPENFILYLGTIEPRKNLPILLRAFHRLVQEGAGLHLVITGKHGWMVEQVRDTIRELHLDRLIHFTGYIPADDLPIVYNLARTFVYPSLYEGFGLPPLEAMACGIPVIASAIPAIQELVGDAGVLFPPQDEEALFQALRMVVEDPSLQAKLSKKGRERSQQFTWKRCAQATLEVYQHLAPH